MRFLIAFAMLAAPAAALADGPVQLASNVFVERIHQDAAGHGTTVLEPPATVTPGDHLLFVLSYRNDGSAPATGFIVTNPVPSAVRFDNAQGEGVEVSVDGGHVWGDLASLRIALPDGTTRPATPADVTHVRWTFSRPIAPGADGRLSFRGTVE